MISYVYSLTSVFKTFDRHITVFTFELACFGIWIFTEYRNSRISFIFTIFTILLIFIHRSVENITMSYSFIAGFSGRSSLLYLHDERHLFVKKVTRDQYEFYECYHNMQKNQLGFVHCSASCSILRGEIRRNGTAHSHPMDHKVDFRDLQSLNAMKETCNWLREHCPSSAHKIPSYDIFMLEIAKWVSV